MAFLIGKDPAQEPLDIVKTLFDSLRMIMIGREFFRKTPILTE